MLLMDRITRRMSPKRTGMHFLFCFVDLALIAPNIRWIRRFSAAAQHLIMVHFNLSPLTPNHKKNFWKDFDLERLFRFVSETFVPHPQVSFLK